jgi:drug/metabolite transporter (DMT)-like permease
VGVVITFAGNLEGGGALGNCMSLLSGLFYSGVFFFNKMPQVDDPVETTLLGNALFLCLLPLCFFDPAFPNPVPSVWAAQVALSLLCGAGAWLAFCKGIKHTSALLANFITIIELPAGAALTFFFLGERPSPLALVGCVSVIVTLLVYYTWQAKNEIPETKEVSTT